MNTTEKMFTAFESLTGIAFVSLKGYKDSIGNVQDVTINVGASLQATKEKDIAYLESLSFEGKDALLEQARLELIASLKEPGKARSDGQKEAYTHICPGVKVHTGTGEIFIFGMVVKRVVTQATEAPEKLDTRKPLTKAKDALRASLKSYKYRVYKLDQISSMKVMGTTIEIG
jgi:hypothetical protein